MSKEQLRKRLEEVHATHRERMASLARVTQGHAAFNDKFEQRISLPTNMKPALQGRRPSGSIVIVPAPGDRCENTGLLPDGSACPGCRACC